uniref:Uncharacterized protein n=1 Tax=Ditylenchus dipsaci TaxID=166011 RepID=A0A915DUP8_9BILA
MENLFACKQQYIIAGADIKEIIPNEFAQVFGGGFLQNWTQVSKVRKPVIAAVNGYALARNSYWNNSWLVLSTYVLSYLCNKHRMEKIGLIDRYSRYNGIWRTSRCYLIWISNDFVQRTYSLNSPTNSSSSKFSKSDAVILRF